MDSTEEKQNYLRTEILDKGYDPNEFIGFLVEKRGENASDIEIWDINDLKQVVQEFIYLHSYQQQEEIENQTKLQDEENDKQFQSALNKKKEEEKNKKQTEKLEAERKKKLLEDQLAQEEIEHNKLLEQKKQKDEQIQRQKILKQQREAAESKKNANRIDIKEKPASSNTNAPADDDDDDDFVKDDAGDQQSNSPEDKQEEAAVATMAVSELSKYDKLNIKIDNPQKVSAGFFSKDYINYTITCEEIKSCVKRRYSDFEWLLDNLVKLYPGSIIFSLGNDNSEKYTDDFIKARIRVLKKFIDSILADPLAKCSKIFYDFLTVRDEKTFNLKRTTYNKDLKPTSLSNMRSITGKAVVTVSKVLENNFNNMKEYETNTEVLYSRLLEQFEYFNDEVLGISNRIISISKIFNELYLNSTKYQDDKNVTEFYNFLSKITSNWADAEKKKMAILNRDLKEHFQFLKYRFTNIKNSISKVDSEKNNFHKAAEKLHSKKDYLFKSQSTDKWEVNQKTIIEEHLTNNRKAAFEKMLPKETKVVNEIRNQYGYFLNMLLSEFDRIKIYDGNKDNKILKGYCKRYLEIDNEVKAIIDDTLKKINDVGGKEN